MGEKDIVTPIDYMGAPGIHIERLPNINEHNYSITAFLQLINSGKYNMETGEVKNFKGTRHCFPILNIHIISIIFNVEYLHLLNTENLKA